MAYTFLTPQDLKAGMIDKFLTERSDEQPEVLMALIETKKIALIKAKLSGRFDTTAIFAATAADRDYLIVDILVKLCLYDFIRRNAARKVPEDFLEDWKWANKQLDMLAAGTLAPDSLPRPETTDTSGDGRFFANIYNTDWNI